MSRVRCIDCGIDVVVDPSGLCSEGHSVGTLGERLEHAIGTNIPHPDEPEPWVSSVDVEDRPEADVGGRSLHPVSTSDPDATTRSIEPLAAPGPLDAHTPSTGVVGDADSEALLRELQSLAELSGSAPEPSTTRAESPGVHAEHPASADENVPSTIDDDATAIATPDHAAAPVGLTELGALEAAVHALETQRVTTDHATPTADRAQPAQPLAPVAAPDTNSTPPPAARHLRLAPPVPAEPSPPSEVTALAVARSPLPADHDEPTARVGPAPAASDPIGERDTDARNPAPALDLASFTARGKRVSNDRGGRRRLFNR